MAHVNTTESKSRQRVNSRDNPRSRNPSLKGNADMLHAHDKQLAVLEERTSRLASDHAALAKEVRDGFSKLELHLTELKDKNSVVDFLKEHWKTLAVMGAVLFTKPTTEVLQFLSQILK